MSVSILRCLAILAGLLNVPVDHAWAAETERPNILFLFADDMTHAAIRELGNAEIHTPNLDRLVRRGTTFTNARNPGGYHGAICVASRTMLATGRFLWNARDLDDRFKAGQKPVPLWSERMQQAGYDTYLTGKWHVAVKPASVFQTVAHVRPGMPATVPQSYDRPQTGKPDRWSPSDESLGGFWQGGRHWSAVTADDAETFLKRAETRERPYFMYVAFNAPHDPRQSPQTSLDRYPLEDIRVPTSFLPEYPWKDAIGCSATLRDEGLAPFPRTEHAIRVHRREYYAAITYLDEQIGRVLDAVEKSSQAKNTYIFFTADHGLAVGHHGLMGKQNLFDHSVRIPFIAIGPRFPANERIAEPIYLQDVVPTALELAEQKVPEDIEFRSLLPLAEGRATTHYEAMYGAYMQHQRSVTQAGWKLILYPDVPKALLFDLQNDPDELHDLSADQTQRERQRKLFAELRKLQASADDPLDLTGVFPELATESRSDGT